MLRLAGLTTILGAAIAVHMVTPTAVSVSDETRSAAALRINQSGFICSEIVSMTPGNSGTIWQVRCVEFHDGTGRAHFALDTRSGLVMQTF